MTHFLFGTRGIYAATQQMITDLNAQRFWWRRKNMTTGKVEDVPVQGILRPFLLWEYVYPESSPTQPGNLDSPMQDNTEIMLRSFDILNEDHYIPKSIGKYVKFVGKVAGLKPIPTIKPEGPKRYIHGLGISVIPIGIKDDEYRIYDFGEAGTYEQEGI